MLETAEYRLLRNAIKAALAQETRPTPELIRERIGEYRVIPSLAVPDEDVERLAREIESQLDIQMTLGSVVQEEGFVEWYPAAKVGIEPYYWDRYRQLMEEKNFPPKVLATLDQVTDTITGLLQNPTLEGPWDRRGMVVGHVQSGKTANYTGLICKAADAGYKLIVVIAGIHNNLRNQTQQRIDEGFIGKDSAALHNPGVNPGPYGVSRFANKHTPYTLTSATSDFNSQLATTVGGSFTSFNVPVVLVIKKNVSTLRNLTNWIKAHNLGWTKDIVDAPMLLIDDEADNASINTSRNPGEASRINAQIRGLMNLFSRACYVGYTATPFANIFISPEADEELKANLFPKHFIVTLDAPTNYFGAERIFGDESGEEFLRPITDNEDALPLIHKIDQSVDDIPGSLKAAVRAFVIARAIRILRGQGASHTSMLVNASRFTGVQSQIRDVIHDYLDKVVRAIRHDGAKPEAEAIRNQHLNDLRETWQAEYSHLDFEWGEIQAQLLEAAAPMTVVEVNSRSAGKLAYDAHKETGLQVIAVGGFSLSRGLTLEGLTISYFLRNSTMYDTLLQMGRWFGYRPGYEDLCRIWMTPEAQGWFEHISESIEELRAELRTMQEAGLTPEDFGLRVKTHPDTLIVTARNKMGTSQEVEVAVGLSKSFVETYALWRTEADVLHNRKAAIDLVGELVAEKGDGRPNVDQGPYRLWSGVRGDRIEAFIRTFRNHDNALQTQSKAVADFIHAGLSGELQLWDVAVVGKANAKGRPDDDLGIICQERTAKDGKKSGYVLVGEKNRVSSRGVEKIGVAIADRAAAEEAFWSDPNNADRKSEPDRIYRAKRTRPLLLIQPLDLKQDDKSLSGPPIIAWSISFPPTTFEYRTATYVVNSTWWNDYMGDDDNGGDEDVVNNAA
ncbi:Z1 domain-containing protein [Hyphomonas sp.]|jgi:hypothetical protein|uniref:Z1 domain-containing protein n=1 Tax=Hyphomonas sp. TaxID=87 RepID=UPI0037C1AD34